MADQANWLVLVESNTTGSGRLFCARARERGLRPVVLARDPARYPYVRADQLDHRVVDTTDLAAVQAACDQLGGPIVGVTSSSEYFIGTAAEVARSRGLPHPDPAAIQACRDKANQREQLQAAGVPGAGFAAATSAAEAVAAADALGYPVVVKPIAGSGSIATRRCTEPAEVSAAATTVLDSDPATLSLPPQRAVLVEEYLAGPEYSVETFDDQVVGITRKLLGPEPHFVETGHDFPAPLPAETAAVIGATALAALRALGLGWGPAHVELRHTATGPRIVEVNPRLAGGMIPRMVQIATGLDLIGRTVDRAAGAVDPGPPGQHRAAAIRFLVADTAGRLVEIAGAQEAQQVPGVVEVGLTHEPGQEVVLRHSFQDRLGYVIAVSDDGASAAAAAQAGVLALKARIVPGATDHPNHRSR